MCSAVVPPRPASALWQRVWAIAPVEILAAGSTNRIVGVHQGKIFDIDIDEALSMNKGLDMEEWAVLEAMTGL